MRVNVVCDVGSMNGEDALAFRAAVPDADVFAFEVNPENVRLMRADSRLRGNSIQVVPLAVTNVTGEADFFVVQADYSTVNDQRGKELSPQAPG